jgi:hypothetical protein
MHAEKGIVAADGGGIRQRWQYGLRLLHDPDAISTGNGGGLRHGIADRLVEAAQARGLKLNPGEIRNRLQCARTYPNESQIAHAVRDFDSWHDLVAARFPAYEPEPDEAPADYRSEVERRHDKARQLALAVGDQGRLFPLSEFEPTESTLKDLVDYAGQMEDLTARFAKVDRERRLYLKTLMEGPNRKPHECRLRRITGRPAPAAVAHPARPDQTDPGVAGHDR